MILDLYQLPLVPKWEFDLMAAEAKFSIKAGTYAALSVSDADPGEFGMLAGIETGLLRSRRLRRKELSGDSTK